MADVILKDAVLDGGLEVLNTLANAIWVCAGTPTDYTDAQAKELGFKTFTVGAAFGNPTNGSPDGRQITSVAITDGTVNNSGTVTCWAVVDAVNSTLLAVGNLTGGMAVTAGWAWTLDAFTIHTPATVGAAYTGPGDIVASATGWWGLRAYSTATIGANAVRIVRASDSTQQDFVTLADGSLDIASIVTFLTSTTGKVVTLYDQTGGGRHLTQSTDANRPTFVLNVLDGGTLPVIRFAGGQELISSTGFPTAADPFFISTVFTPTITALGYRTVFGGSSAFPQVGTQDLAGGTFSPFNGAQWFTTATTATSTVPAAVQWLFNGASSKVFFGGTSETGNSGASGLGVGGARPTLGAVATGNDYFGDCVEVGVWLGDKSSDVTSLTANQNAHYGI